MQKYNINQHIMKRLINVYGGSERKETVVLDDGNQYLLKLPDPTRETDRNLSYINNAVSEYLGCKIIKEIGLPVQEVIIGEYSVPSFSTGKIKTYIACACRNLEENGLSLAEAEGTSLGSDDDTKSAAYPSFFTLSKIAQYTPEIPEETIRDFYAKQFVADALIGNKDRHNGNWGFLTGIDGSRMAPIYDCGSSLCPLYDDSELSEKIAVNEAMNGLSAIRDDHGKQIVYRDYLMSGINQDVNLALKKIMSKINMEHIYQIVNDTPYISEKRKEFYHIFLSVKYMRVLLPALENIVEKEWKYENLILKQENIYELYRKVIQPWAGFPLFEKHRVMINDIMIEVMKVSNKYILLIDEKRQEVINMVSTRSNNSEALKSLQRLAAEFETTIENLPNVIIMYPKS